jgi:hypothetical protein
VICSSRDVLIEQLGNGEDGGVGVRHCHSGGDTLLGLVSSNHVIYTCLDIERGGSHRAATLSIQTLNIKLSFCSMAHLVGGSTVTVMQLSFTPLSLPPPSSSLPPFLPPSLPPSLLLSL